MVTGGLSLSTQSFRFRKAFRGVMASTAAMCAAPMLAASRARVAGSRARPSPALSAPAARKARMPRVNKKPRRVTAQAVSGAPITINGMDAVSTSSSAVFAKVCWGEPIASYPHCSLPISPANWIGVYVAKRAPPRASPFGRPLIPCRNLRLYISDLWK